MYIKPSVSFPFLLLPVIAGVPLSHNSTDTDSLVSSFSSVPCDTVSSLTGHTELSGINFTQRHSTARELAGFQNHLVGDCDLLFDVRGDSEMT